MIYTAHINYPSGHKSAPVQFTLSDTATEAQVKRAAKLAVMWEGLRGLWIGQSYNPDGLTFLCDGGADVLKVKKA